ncbi:MAG: hypothetical protein DRN33_03955 [Thermoplasmata archaeon]|nr:MAG: hypothetical protein DRN33_03955 [Thermoplasmata archaeon]
MTGNDKKIAILFVIAISFIFLRIYNIQNPFSTNGVDEGIHLIQAKMVSSGYNLYSDLGGDQAPLAILSFAALGGDVMAARYLSFSLFLIAAFSSFLISVRIKNRNTGVLTVLILALDFTLLRESRLASLDLFSASLLSISALFFILYIDDRKVANIALASFFLSISCLSKMIAAPFAIIVTLLFFYLSVKERRYVHIISYAIFFAIPFLLLLFMFTPQELIEGILLRQANRGFDIFSKLSFLLFIGPGFIYLISVKKWDIKNRKIAFLIIWLASLLIFIMIQGRTLHHHFVYIVFPAAILSSIALSELPENSLKGRTLLTSFIVINAALSASLILTAPHDLAYEVADEVEAIVPGDYMVISGNPLVNVLTGREPPPNLTNLAYYHCPQTEPSDVIYWIEKGNVGAVVFYWHLADMDEVREYLNESGNYVMYKIVEGKGQILFDGIMPGFSEDRYVIYVKKELLKPGP